MYRQADAHRTCKAVSAFLWCGVSVSDGEGLCSELPSDKAGHAEVSAFSSTYAFQVFLGHTCHPDMCIHAFRVDIYFLQL